MSGTWFVMSDCLCNLSSLLWACIVSLAVLSHREYPFCSVGSNPSSPGCRRTAAGTHTGLLPPRHGLHDATLVMVTITKPDSLSPGSHGCNYMNRFQTGRVTFSMCQLIMKLDFLTYFIFIYMSMMSGEIKDVYPEPPVCLAADRIVMWSFHSF